MTSFQTLYSIKKKLETRKVGHTGTLDRFAKGLMVVLTGPALKLSPYLTGLDKTYEALIHFGVETDTLDPEGSVVGTAPLPDMKQIPEVLQSFVGRQKQRPPAFSAVHIDGERAHRLARSGKTPEMPLRDIEIHAIELLEYREPDLLCRIYCSKGTYIRSFARDLAYRLGTRGHVKNLIRTAVGRHTLNNAVSPEDFDPAEHLLTGTELQRCIPGSGTLTLTSQLSQKVRHGTQMYAQTLEDLTEGPIPEVVFLNDSNGNILAAVSSGVSGEGTRSLKYIFVVPQ